MRPDSWNTKLLLPCVAWRRGSFFLQVLADVQSTVRSDLRTAPTGCLTVDINLYLSSSSVKVGHLLMCVMLHNRLCSRKGEALLCVNTAGLMGNASMSFQSKSLPAGEHWNRNTLWSFAVSLTPPPRVLQQDSPRRKRSRRWDSSRVTKWANKLC